MTVYKDAKQVNRFIDAAPSNFDFYVHIDKKSALRADDISQRANVCSVYKIYWGAVEHLKAFLLLMEQAYTSGKGYDFYHLATGQDFFACPLSKFDSLLKPGNIYMDIFHLPKKGWWHGGLHILRYKTLASKMDLRLRCNKLLDKLYLYWQYLTCQARPLPAYPLAGGSVYFSISTGGVKFILESAIAKDLLGRMENTTCAEEIFFQTVLINSRYRDRIIANNLRYMDWSVPSPPKFLTEKDFEKIVQSGSLFCRKIDSNVSKKLIDKLLRMKNQVIL